MDLATLSSPARDPASTFLPQSRGAGLPDGLPWGTANGNCGPTSVVNALRFVGLDVPGFHGERSQSAIDAARVMMTGVNDPSKATTKSQQAAAMRDAGARVDASFSLLEGLAAVRRGAALLIGGNRAATRWPRRPDDPPPTAPAAHAVVVVRGAANAAPGTYTLLDPALDAPRSVTTRQLRDFVQLTAPDRMLRPGLIVTDPATMSPTVAARRRASEPSPLPAR